jgi:hypothetical protein
LEDIREACCKDKAFAVSLELCTVPISDTFFFAEKSSLLE